MAFGNGAQAPVMNISDIEIALQQAFQRGDAPPWGLIARALHDLQRLADAQQRIASVLESDAKSTPDPLFKNANSA